MLKITKPFHFPRILQPKESDIILWKGGQWPASFAIPLGERNSEIMKATNDSLFSPTPPFSIKEHCHPTEKAPAWGVPMPSQALQHGSWIAFPLLAGEVRLTVEQMSVNSAQIAVFGTVV